MVELAKPVNLYLAQKWQDVFLYSDIAREREAWQTRLDAEKRLSEARREEGAKVLARADKAEAELKELKNNV